MHLNGKRRTSLPKPASCPISSRYKDLLTLVIWTLRILPLSLRCAVLDWHQKGGHTSKAQEEAGFLTTLSCASSFLMLSTCLHVSLSPVPVPSSRSSCVTFQGTFQSCRFDLTLPRTPCPHPSPDSTSPPGPQNRPGPPAPASGLLPHCPARCSLCLSVHSSFEAS